MAMQRLDSIIRRMVPSVPVLSRNRLLMGPLDLLDSVVFRLSGDARRLPPNRMRLRVGAGNRLLFNRMLYRSLPINFWLNAFASGVVRLDSRILDVGSGCGRYAATLRDFGFFGAAFQGQYTGIDVDGEMVEWCRRNFPADRFTFKLSPARSTVYNPDGGTAADYDLPEASRDFVFSVSLLTHLLAADFIHHVGEALRVLAPGATTMMTVFCMDHLAEGGLGGRWTFKHRRGEAYVENPAYPEAAVAYTLEWIRDTCVGAGLTDVEVIKGGGQSLIRARKRSRAP